MNDLSEWWGMFRSAADRISDRDAESDQAWIEQQREQAAEAGSGAGRLTDAAHARDLHEDRRERQLEELEGWAGAQ